MMISSNTKRLDVVDTLFDPASTIKKVQYRTEDGKSLYKVWLHLTGSDLPYVRGVTYHLHQTFPQPVQFVPRTPANPTCALVIWTWGIFDVKAVADMESGEQITIPHPLKYDRQLRQVEEDQFAEE